MPSISGRSFIIDPGHGGRYDGATYGTRKEKDVVLRFSRILESKLKAKGCTVYMTRTTDVDFGGSTADEDVNKRVQYINNNFPGVNGLISIHVNAAFGPPPHKYGPFYQTGTVSSKAFAEAIAKRYGTAAHEGDFAVIRDTNRAGQKTLIELATIDESWLDNQASLENTANFIILGLEDYTGY
ncbi:N-acetylmuramoyl-L-alanine amidase [Paenibacillus sp. P25]|nr:N-acetylmuramoyl-L-alanine amidase [Paenibacillus sp. P25]